MTDCLDMMDGDGTFRHYRYAGGLADQMWVDVQVYRIIRGRWVELHQPKDVGQYGQKGHR